MSLWWIDWRDDSILLMRVYIFWLEEGMVILMVLSSYGHYYAFLSKILS